MRASLFLGVGLLGVVAVVEACGISSESTPPDNDIGSFCADYAKAMCQVSTACNVASPTACITYQTNACSTQYSSQVSSTRSYNQPNGKACVDKLNTAYEGTTVSAATLKDVAATCNKVVIGNLQTNGVCTGDNDCSGMLVCTPYGAQMRCGPVSMKNPGDPCADPGDTCTGDSYCAPQAGGGAPICAATPGLGQACSATIPCGTSGHCVANKCAARAADNSACTSNDDCISRFCDPNYAQCAEGLAFAHGSDDCKGVLGSNASDAGVVIAQPEAGGAGNDGGVTTSEAGD